MAQQERELYAQSLMVSLSPDGMPVTITETGEMFEGVEDELSDHEADEEVDDTDEALLTLEEYGVCQQCLLAGTACNDERLVVGREVWSLCETHKVCWLSGMTNWPSLTDPEGDDWHANDVRLKGYKKVMKVIPDPVGLNVPKPVDPSLQEASYDRLWTILRSTHGDRALLMWILDTHQDLPSALARLIRRKLDEDGRQGETHAQAPQ